jgi:chromosome segregation ATPase
MEAIKLKMDALVKDKVELIKVAQSHESEISDYEQKCKSLESDIRVKEKAIAHAEDDLDKTLTEYINHQEKLDNANDIASHAELEVNALNRKVKLLEQEQQSVEERYKVTIASLSEYEKAFEDNERERKIHETKSFATEEKIELMVTQLEEATNIAEEADRKYEEVLRKAKVVEAELERINEKAEDFEQKISEYETELSENSESLRKMEVICSKNTDKEDEYDNEQRSLIDKLKVAETNAEFGERTVEKLEKTIDGIQEALFEEKMNYRDISVKLDNTLRDMMTIAEEAHNCE